MWRERSLAPTAYDDRNFRCSPEGITEAWYHHYVMTWQVFWQMSHPVTAVSRPHKASWQTFLFSAPYRAPFLKRCHFPHDLGFGFWKLLPHTECVVFKLSLYFTTHIVRDWCTSRVYHPSKAYSRGLLCLLPIKGVCLFSVRHLPNTHFGKKRWQKAVEEGPLD